MTAVWIALGVFLGVYAFAWSLCRAAARGDEQLAHLGDVAPKHTERAL